MKNSINHSIKLKPLSIEEYQFVLNWSNDDKFCLASGWRKNRSEEELYDWWLNHVNNTSDNCVRMGIEFNERLIGYADLASIKNNCAEIGIAIGESAL